MKIWNISFFAKRLWFQTEVRLYVEIHLHFKAFEETAENVANCSLFVSRRFNVKDSEALTIFLHFNWSYSWFLIQSKLCSLRLLASNSLVSEKL